MADSPFRTNPSAIARYFFHGCERYLRYQAAGPELQRKEGIPSREFDHSPLVKALLESGYAWEQIVLDEHLADRVAVAPGDAPRHTRRFDWQQTLDLLRTARTGTYIYQPTLHLPPSFYERFGIDRSFVTISDNHPDLIAVQESPDRTRRLRLIDLKSGESLQLAHRIQVLLYALELETVVRSSQLDDLTIDREVGAVWLGSRPQPTEFTLREIEPHLDSFLRHDMTRVLRSNAHETRWHVQSRCEWCEYFRHCWSEMQRADDLSRLSHLTPRGKQFLRERVGVHGTAELGSFLQRPDADGVLARCATLAGQRPRLMRQVEALQCGAPQPLGSASPSLSRGENVAIFVTLGEEPLGESVYLAGIYVTMRKDLRAAVFCEELQAKLFDGAKSRPQVLVAARPDTVSETRREWIHLLYKIVVQVHEYNAGREWDEQLSLQAYVLSEKERQLLVSSLLDALRDPELAEQAMALLFHFQAPELLVASEHPDREVPFPSVVLLDTVAQVLALPVEVSYTLPEVLHSLGSRSSLRRNDYYDFPLGPGLRAEPIHAAWYRGKTELLDEIAGQIRVRLQAMWALLQSVRHHAKEAIFAWSAKFNLPGRMEFPDPLLSRLAFFARYESLLRCLKIRNSRCEPKPVQLLTGQAIELEAIGDERFAIVSGAAEIEPNGFPEWLLVTDSEAGRRAQLEYRDYASRAQWWQGRKQADLALVNVADVERDELGTPSVVTIEYQRPFEGDGPQPGQRLLLHPRFTDFTTDGVVEFLRAAGLGVHRLFLRLLRDPSEAAEPLPLPTDAHEKVCHEAATRRLTDSQRDALDRICRRRVVPVWGPPGTGKTHFLATAILLLASGYARMGRPFRVLVTAFTHAAIENLLRKIAALNGIATAGDPPEHAALKRPADLMLAIGKAKDWQGDVADAAEVVPDREIGSWLEARAHAVLGATVYSCLKKFTELPPFDLVVIDEASQLRVPEAAVPVGLVGPEGRLILAGDHMQLPPIVVGSYPEAGPTEPVVHRSIFEAVAGRFTEAAADVRSGVVCPLSENFRMNDVLTSFAARLLYGPAYRSFDRVVADRRLDLLPERSLDPVVEACLAPQFPLVVVVLDGVWAARENPAEAELVARLVAGIRGTLRGSCGKLFSDDGAFFREGVFVVSPHRAQIRAIRRELRRQRTWQSPPVVDTVDKMQGQEADAVIVSYGVADSEFALQEAEFIYGLNRLNVAVTRAKSKCVLCLPKPLLDAPPQVLDTPEAARGLAYMRALVDAVARHGDAQSFDLGDGMRATVYRAGKCLVTTQEEIPMADKSHALPRAETETSVAGSPRGPATLKAAAKTASSNARRRSPRKSSVRRSARPDRAVEPSAADAAPDYSAPEWGMPDTRSLAPILSRLNEPQQAAATHGDGPLLIVAGAGTGKTTTLVHRVAWLIARGVPPQRILLLTFTRRAAREMLRRVSSMLSQSDIDRHVWGGTFHGTATRLLRIYAKAAGLPPQFTIADQSDAEDLMGEAWQQLKTGKADKKFPKKRTCLAIHSYCVNAQQPLPDVLATRFVQHKTYAEPLERLFTAYTERKAEANILDFDDLLLRWCDLLDHAEAGPSIRGRFDCVLVDEYQDTNRLQGRLLRGLCPDGRGLTVVGDDAQSIYSFRAATVRNILDFPEQHSDATVIKLEQNYRSTMPILATTNRVMGESRQGFSKELWSTRTAGPKPQFIRCADEEDQAEFAVGRILDHQKRGIPLSQQAVLFRASHHSILLEGALARHDLPFVKYGGLKFVEAAHVKDLLSLIRLAENPRDFVSGARALCLLPGIGPKKAAQLLGQLTGADGKFSVWTETAVPATSQELWPKLVTLLDWLANVPSSGDLQSQVRRAIDFYQPLLQEKYNNPTQRLADLEQLELLAGGFPDRAGMLADLAIDPPGTTAEASGEAVAGDCLVLSTMHSAKGLEWPVVYVLHATDGKIPLEYATWDVDELEEERRLFYVALTRAADWLYVCHPQQEPVSMGKGSHLWGGSVYEQRERSRFISKSVLSCFQTQGATSFEMPGTRAPASPSTPKQSRLRKRTR